MLDIYCEQDLKAQVLQGDRDALSKLEDIWFSKYQPAIECFLCNKFYHESAYQAHKSSCMKALEPALNRQFAHRKNTANLIRVTKEPLYVKQTAPAGANCITFFGDLKAAEDRHPILSDYHLPYNCEFRAYGLSVIPNCTLPIYLNEYLKIWLTGRVQIKIGNYVCGSFLAKQALTNPAEMPGLDHKDRIVHLDSLKKRLPLTVSGNPLELISLEKFEVSLVWDDPLAVAVPMHCVVFGLLLNGISSVKA